MPDNVGCIYHNADLDGKCSGAIVRLFEEHAGNKVELIGLDYKDFASNTDPGDFDPTHLIGFDRLYIVDFSLPPSLMLLLRAHYKAELIWIDHHRSAIALSEIHGYGDITGSRAEHLAACELTWVWFTRTREGNCLPVAVRLLGRYDVWDHEDGDVLPFQYGMRGEENDPEKVLWGLVLPDPDALDLEESCSHTFDVVLDRGRAIYDYLQEHWRIQTRALAREIDWAGHTFVAANIPLGNSKILETLYPDKDTLFLLYYQNKRGDWKVSMYTRNESVDLSEIAVKYGGGGHAGACGFNCAVIPNELRTALMSEVLDEVD